MAEDTNGNSSQPPPPQQQQQQQQQVTVDDLDVEEAEGYVLQAAEQMHRQHRHRSNAPTVGFAAMPVTDSSFTPPRRGASAPPQQQHQHQQQQPHPLKSALRHGPHARLVAVQKGNTERMKRMYLIKMAARKAQAAPVAVYLHDIQASSTGTSSFDASAASMDADTEGLMQILQPQRRDPYATNFDHHLLKAHSSYERREEQQPYDERRHHHHQRRHSQSSLPLQATDYMATHPDGYVPHQSPQHQLNHNNNYPAYNHNQHTARRSHMHYPTTTTTTMPTTTTGRRKKKFWMPRWIRELAALLHPFRIFHNCLDVLVQSYFLWVGVPCLVLAACLFYLLDNPVGLYFMPTGTSLASWLLFATRQTVTLGLARLSVFVVVDGFMLGTHLAVQTLGPLLTLAAATGKGWPLMLSTWGLWNLVLIHGETPFQKNWFYWTELDLFNLNDNGLLVNSECTFHCA